MKEMALSGRLAGRFLGTAVRCTVGLPVVSRDSGGVRLPWRNSAGAPYVEEPPLDGGTCCLAL